MTLRFADSVTGAEEVSRPERRVAVLIGNGNCHDPGITKLVGPPKDVSNLHQVLSDPERGNFEVHALVDAGFLEVRQTIASVAKECTPADLLLIYYSGFGFLDSDRLYLPVVDTKISLAYATAFDCDFFMDTFARTRAGRKLLILDCCHAGAFFHGNRGIPDGFAALASCGKHEACGDGPDGGVFTKCLIDGLVTNDADCDHDGRVTVDEAFDYVRKRLAGPNARANPQRWVWNLPEPIFLTIASRPVFISYSRKDSAFVEPLFESLQRHGVPVWMDVDGVQGGDDWLQRILAALQSSRFVAAIISPEALISKWVKRELEFADNRSIPILPIVMPNVEMPDWFDLRFNSLQRLDCDPSSTQSVESVVRRISDLYKEVRPNHSLNRSDRQRVS